LLQVALSPDEQTLATIIHVERATEDAFDPNRHLFLANLWATASGTPAATLQAQPDWRAIDNIAFSPDGTALLVSGATTLSEAGANRLVRVWDVATGALRYGLDFGEATRAQFSPNGTQLVTVNEKEIALWNTATGSNLAHIPAGDTPLSAGAMSFTNDDTHMIVPDGFSFTARLWDLNARQSLFSLSGHSGRIAQLQLAPNGSLILTTSPGDRSVRLWEGMTGTQRTLLPLRADHAELSAQGRYVLVLENGMASIHLVRFDDLLALARSRVTRSLTCEEERDFLHNAVVCAVVTPPAVAN
jgi:WD40 repeat protein